MRDGAEALARLRDPEANAALLDIAMPRLNGYEVARQLRQDHVSVTLIAVTGWAPRRMIASGPCRPAFIIT